jgi:ankyrin repeat protein
VAYIARAHIAKGDRVWYKTTTNMSAPGNFDIFIDEAKAPALTAPVEMPFKAYFNVCQTGDIEAIESQIQKLNVPVDAKNHLGLNGARLALVGSGNVDTAMLMLRKGYVTPEDQDVEGCRLLHACARHGYLDLMKLLVEFYHVDLNPTALEPKYCETPLHRATTYGQFETMKYLIEAGAKVDVLSSDGRTVLHCAAHSGEYRLVVYLLDLKNPDTGRPYFQVDERNNVCTMTPLISGAMHFDVSKKLLERGADPEIMDTRGTTAVIRALDHRSWDVAALLIGCGAELKVHTSRGLSVEEFLKADKDGSLAMKKGLKAFKRRKEEFIAFCYKEYPEFQVFQRVLFDIVFEYCPSACTAMLSIETITGMGAGESTSPPPTSPKSRQNRPCSIS